MTVDSYEQRRGEAFRSLPEIYQVELTNHCNLKCPMCLRTTDMVRDPQHVDLALITKMLERGDFDGTAYTELQMAGEPTLHPEMGLVIDALHKFGIMVGASTHGHTIKKKAGVLDALLKLDALTISVDSLDPETYARMRVPMQLAPLLDNIDMLVKEARLIRDMGRTPIPFVELQLVNTEARDGLGDGDLHALDALIYTRHWEDVVTGRVTYDCFLEMQDVVSVGSLARNETLCINPWTSVSVASDGSVASCCYIFEPDPSSPNTYGNLNTHSLAEVWAGKKVAAMREAQRTGDMIGQCRKCYLKSPTLIHQNIVARLVRSRR